MPAIGDVHILIMATNRFEESELFGPREILLGKGAKVSLASPTREEIMATVHDEPGKRIKPDLTVEEVRPEQYDALILPGGVGNPDQLRMNPDAVALIRDFAEAGKPVAAICHGPWLLVEADLLRGRRDLERDTVLAAVVRLLDREHIRIGNEEYVRANKSFGATTLRNRHLKHAGGKLKMRFPGKGGAVHEVTVTDRNLKRVVRKAQDLPGQMLFQYVNGDGNPQAITSGDVNDYIRDATGGDFTAKHFRTWGASVIFFKQLLAKAEEKRLSIKTALEPVAEALGNTPAISRKSYVHPALVELLREDPRDPLHGFIPPPPRRGLSSAESAFVSFLRMMKPHRRRKVAA